MSAKVLAKADSMKKIKEKSPKVVQRKKPMSKQKTQKSRNSRETMTDADGEKKAMMMGKPTTVNGKWLLHENDVLLDRFQIIGMVARGGFGQVFLGTDRVTGEKCAVKALSGNEGERRNKLEMMLYTQLRGKKCIPLLLAACPLPNQRVNGPGGVLVMQLVGRNLADVRRQMPTKSFSVPTLYRAMRQVLVAISYIHATGYLHRDVKPQNCCLGAVDCSKIYLLDLGLARQYVDSAGMVRRARKKTLFRGTVRYASLCGHALQEFGPFSDLVAFVYSTIELGNGCLPWSRKPEIEATIKLKTKTTNVELCENFPKLLDFTNAVMELKFNTIPDHKSLLKLFDQFKPVDVTDACGYDWELNESCICVTLIVLLTKRGHRAFSAVRNQCVYRQPDLDSQSTRVAAF